MKKNIIKKVCAVILGISLLSSFILPCSALAITADLSNPAVMQQVVEIMRNYEKDPQGVREKLEKMGVFLNNEPSIEYCSSDNNGSAITTYGINPSDYKLSVYDMSNKTATNIWVTWTVESTRNEWFPGPLDYASIEYDSNVGIYKESSADDEIVTVQERKTGVVAYNVEDHKLSNGTMAYGSINVTVPRGKIFRYGCKYVHTYSTVIFSGGSASYSLTPSAELSASGHSGLGLEYTYGLKVDVGTSTNKWQRWVDNSVTV